jgi:hypothetical protein
LTVPDFLCLLWICYTFRHLNAMDVGLPAYHSSEITLLGR